MNIFSIKSKKEDIPAGPRCRTEYIIKVTLQKYVGMKWIGLS
jgi:hypothetical protein